MNDLKKYQAKLKLEAILKSVIYGLSGAFIIIIFLNIIFYFCKVHSLLITILVGVISGIITAFLLYFKKFNVTLKDIARRIDEQGLEERVVTMVEFGEDASPMAELQKNDTKLKLAKIDAKAIPLKIAKLSIIILIVCCILAVPTCFLNPASANTNNPSNIPPIDVPELPNEEKPVEEQVEDIINKLLEELHKIVDEAAVNKNVKDLLNQILDELETNLKQENLTIDEKVEMILETKEKILQIIKENTVFIMTIAGVLKTYPLTTPLGDAIKNRDLAAVDTALENIRKTVNESENKEGQINTLISILNEALVKAKDEDNLGLIEAIKTFVTDLGGEVTVPEEPVVQNLGVMLIADEEREPAQTFDEAIDYAKENIKNALMSDNQLQDKGNEMADEIQDALEQISDAMSGNQDSEDNNNQEQPSIGGNEGDPTDEDTPPVIVDDQDPLASEKVIDGKTPYLEVLEEYKQQIIDYLNNNDLDEETRKMIETYLEMIG